jgi:hypothetical protein
MAADRIHARCLGTARRRKAEEQFPVELNRGRIAAFLNGVRGVLMGGEGFMRQFIRLFVVVILSALSAGVGALALGRTASHLSADVRSRLAYSSGRKTQYELDVSGDKQWTDSGIDLLAGDQLVITATGSIEILGKQCGPEGLPRGWMDLLRVPPVPDAGHGALIGRVGNTEAAQPFAVGQRREMRVAYDGRLFLGINEQSSEQADGKSKFGLRPRQAAPKRCQTSRAPARHRACPPTHLKRFRAGLGTRTGIPATWSIS